MKKLILLTCLLGSLFSLPAQASVEVDVATSQWKTLDLPNRFPQTFVVASDLSPMFFATGESIDELAEFLSTLKSKPAEFDGDDEDKAKIINMMKVVFDKVPNTNKSEQADKVYLINVSVNKLFSCKPCTEQRDFNSSLGSNDFAQIHINLIE